MKHIKNFMCKQNKHMRPCDNFVLYIRAFS